MNNLIKEGLVKTKVSKRFWICTIIIAGFSVLAVVLYKLMNDAFADDGVDKEETTLGVIFNMLGNLSLFMAIVPAMLLVRDFTQNTVRNKIIAGNSRTKIYLAHTVVFSIISLFYHFVSIAVAVMFGVPVLGMGEVDSACFAYNMGVSVLVVLAYASMTIFLVMLFRTVSGVIIAYVINTMLTLTAGIVMGFSRNEDITNLIYSVVLDMQATVLTESMAAQTFPDDPVKLLIPLADLCYIVGLPILGIQLFKKADLK